MSLATLLGLVQIRSIANQRLAAALAADLRDSLARDAVQERLRGLVADQMVADSPRSDRPALDGTAFSISQNGQTWEVNVQDVLGLIDVYFTSPPILQRVLPDSRRFIARRDAALSAVAEGSRFPHIAMSLAQFGLAQAEWTIFTQSSTGGLIRLQNAPLTLAQNLRDLPNTLTISGQVQRVRVTVQRNKIIGQP